MRFNTDQCYLFMYILYKAGSETSWPPVYTPWTDTLIDIKLEVMDCVDKQKVPDAYDPLRKPVYDGFAFEDRWGRLWSNNYQQASYGQVSTSADDWIWLLENKMNDDIYRMERADVRLCKILEGVHTLRQMADDAPEINKSDFRRKADSLLSFYKDLKDKIEKQFQVTVCAFPKVIGSGKRLFQEVAFV